LHGQGALHGSAGEKAGGSEAVLVEGNNDSDSHFGRGFNNIVWGDGNGCRVDPERTEDISSSGFDLGSRGTGDNATSRRFVNGVIDRVIQHSEAAEFECSKEEEEDDWESNGEFNNHSTTSTRMGSTRMGSIDTNGNEGMLLGTR
jgi:hypothetical protein